MAIGSPITGPGGVSAIARVRQRLEALVTDPRNPTRPVRLPGQPAASVAEARENVQTAGRRQAVEQERAALQEVTGGQAVFTLALQAPPRRPALAARAARGPDLSRGREDLQRNRVRERRSARATVSPRATVDGPSRRPAIPQSTARARPTTPGLTPPRRPALETREVPRAPRTPDSDNAGPLVRPRRAVQTLRFARFSAGETRLTDLGRNVDTTI